MYHNVTTTVNIQQTKSKVAYKETLNPHNHEFHETCHSVTFYFMKNSFSDIRKKCILPNMIGAVNGPNDIW